MSTERSSEQQGDRRLGRAARGSAVNLAGAGVSAVANFGLTIVVTRLVAQDEAGVFFSATSLFLLATAIGQLGTDTGLVYFISGARARGYPVRAQSYMRVAGLPVLIASGMLALVVFVAAEPLGLLLSPGREQEFATYMRVMSFFIPFAAVVNLSLAGTQGLGTMRPYATMDHVCKPLLQIVLIGLALVLVGAESIAWAWSVAYLPVAVLSWIWWRRLRDRATKQQRDLDFRAGRPFWRFTAPRAFANVTQVAMQRLDIILVGALAGLAEAAIYAAATRFLVIGQMIARAVAMSGQPLLGEAMAVGDRLGVQRLYRATTSWLILATWPWYLTLMLSAPLVLKVFGTDYTGGASALFLLCATMLFATSCGMVDMVLNMAGRSFLNLFNVVTAFVVFVGLDVLLIPSLGLLGAAIGWSAAIAMANFLPLVQVWFVVRVNPYGRATAIAVAASSAAFGAVPGAVVLGVGTSLGGLAAGLSLGAVLYGLIIWRFRTELYVDVLLLAIRRRKGKPQRLRSV